MWDWAYRLLFKPLIPVVPAKYQEQLNRTVWGTVLGLGSGSYLPGAITTITNSILKGNTGAIQAAQILSPGELTPAAQILSPVAPAAVATTTSRAGKARVISHAEAMAILYGR